MAAFEHLFGPVMQNAFVVDDLQAAIEHWARVMHVGPFFVFERVPFKEVWYRGLPANDIDLTVAIAYWGEVQIELIRQRNDVPSIYTEFRARHGTGLQHMGVMSADLGRDLTRLKAAGIEPVQHGNAAGMRFAYVMTDHHPGGMVELIEATPKTVAFFEHMRRAARDWSGRDAIAAPP
jgi:glyoxalase/bleomycin resistance protein/dioxygenase superfamily protein